MSRCGHLCPPSVRRSWLHGAGQARSPVRGVHAPRPRLHVSSCQSGLGPRRDPWPLTAAGWPSCGAGPLLHRAAWGPDGAQQGPGTGTEPCPGLREQRRVCTGFGRRCPVRTSRPAPALRGLPLCPGHSLPPRPPPDKLLFFFSPQLRHAPRSLLDSTPTSTHSTYILLSKIFLT